MLDILTEMFPEDIANSIFMFVSHHIADLVKGGLTYREIMRYPSYVIDLKSLSCYYFLVFNM